MLRRVFLTALFTLLIPVASLLAAYPYDSVCEIMASSGRNFSGGSATLIAVSQSQALLLTARHVVEFQGNSIKVHWAATGERTTGTVLRIGQDGLDIALCICPRPKGLRPVPVVLPTILGSGPIVNAGFPGVTGVLEWQTGSITGLDSTELEYDCRPIPGMSGGATFDKYGNLIGVIQYYSLKGGGSTSGTSFYNFVNQFIVAQQASWEHAAAQKVELLVTPPEWQKTQAPDSLVEFLIYINTKQHRVPPTPPGCPAAKPKTDEDIIAVGKVVHRKTNGQNRITEPQKRRIIHRRL